MSEGVLADPGRALRLRGDAPGRRCARRRCESLPPLAPPTPWSTSPETRSCRRRSGSTLASVALDLGLEYRAPGIRLTPPPAERIDTDVPVLAVIGTGKRTGKTALGTHLAALLRDAGRAPVVVSMGRGGSGAARAGRARTRCPAWGTCSTSCAAADTPHPTTSRTPCWPVSTTVGCRRCGEGPAGETFESNVVEGVGLALREDPGILVLEGSGAALPPVAADRTVCVTSAAPCARPAPCHISVRSGCCARTCWSCSARPRWRRPSATGWSTGLAEWIPRDRSRSASSSPSPRKRCRTARAWHASRPRGRGAEMRQREALARRGVEPRRWSGNLARRRDLEHDVEQALSDGLRRLPDGAEGGGHRDRRDSRGAGRGAGRVPSQPPGGVAGESLDDRLLRFAGAGVPSR